MEKKEFKENDIVFILKDETEWGPYHQSEIVCRTCLGKVVRKFENFTSDKSLQFYKVHILGWERPFSIDTFSSNEMKPFHTDFEGKKWSEL